MRRPAKVLNRLREQDMGMVSPGDVPLRHRLRTRFGKLATALRLYGPAGRLLEAAARAAPRYRNPAVALTHLGTRTGDERRALLAASRFFGAALNPGPLRSVCQRLFETGAGFGDVAAMLRDISGEIRVDNPMRERVRRAAAPDDVEAWNRRVDYGALTAQMTFGRLRQRKSAAHLTQMFEPMDWTAVERLREAGRPVILANAHVGPEMTNLQGQMDAGFPLIFMLAVRQVQARPHVELVHVQQPAGRGTHLVRVVRRLRKGAVVSASPDERFGGDLVRTTFLGGPAEVSPAYASLAYLTGASTFSVWTELTPEGRIRQFLEEFPALDPSLAEDDWVNAWIRAYLDSIERRLIRNPELVRLFSGIWRRANWTAEEAARYRSGA